MYRTAARSSGAPWWQWAFLSLGVILVEAVMATAGVLTVLLQGVDIRDYISMDRPPVITDGVVAAGFALLLAGQSLGPLLVIPLFRPARAAAFAGLRAPGAGMVRRVVVGLAPALLVQRVWSVFGPLPTEQWRLVERTVCAAAGGGRLWPILWLFAAVVIVAPVAEEILFRGLVFGTVRRSWGFWAGALASAAVSGLAHGLSSALPGALLGLYYAYQAERDESLAGAMLLHALNNYAAILFMLLETVPLAGR